MKIIMRHPSVVSACIHFILQIAENHLYFCYKEAVLCLVHMYKCVYTDISINFSEIFNYFFCLSFLSISNSNLENILIEVY